MPVNTRVARLKKIRTTRKMNCAKNSVVTTFLQMLNMVKVYHWNTRSYAEHKSTDELYDRLNKNVDQFVETMLGKRGDRLPNIDQRLPIMSKSRGDFKHRILQYREYLKKLDTCFEGETDLLNIRDEILGDINQFLYLMTFH
jgi:DNA-binding ferritin-like protein